MLVQFDGTMSGTSKENRRHEPWMFFGAAVDPIGAEL
jgi:hypothetical protein